MGLIVSTVKEGGRVEGVALDLIGNEGSMCVEQIELSGGEVAHPEVADAARGTQLVECAGDFRCVHQRVGAVEEQ